MPGDRDKDPLAADPATYRTLGAATSVVYGDPDALARDLFDLPATYDDGPDSAALAAAVARFLTGWALDTGGVSFALSVGLADAAACPAPPCEPGSSESLSWRPVRVPPSIVM